MKKSLLTAAFAALALGAAQALTIDWSGATTVDIADSAVTRGSYTLELGGATKWSAKVTLKLGNGFSFAQYPSGARYPGVVGVSGTTFLTMNMFSSDAASNGAITIDTNTGTSSVNLGSVKAVANTSYTLTISGNGEMIAFYVNDVLIGTTAAASGNPTIFWGAQNAGTSGGNPLANGANRDVGDVVFSDLTVKTGVAVLPEPTALALLALGVAGVALRRRVA